VLKKLVQVAYVVLLWYQDPVKMCSTAV